MEGLLSYILTFINAGFFIYGVSMISFYFIGIFLANRGILKARRRNIFLRSNDVITASDLPHITLIAPAFNEGPTIIDNVLSLLLLKYPYYDLIVVNDGSKDDSLQKLIDKFDLEVDLQNPSENPIKTARVRNIYKSKNPSYKNLTIIDKENGGRSDAINTGINFSSSELILCTDADCIIEESALVMAKKYKTIMILIKRIC